MDTNIVPKMKHLLDWFMDRFWVDLGRISGGGQVGAKLAPKSTKHRSKSDACCETRFFEKSCSPCSGGSIFSRFARPSWSPKPIKNRSKFEVQVRVPLGIDISSILVGSGSQVGKENRAKIDQKSIQKGIQQIISKRVRLGGSQGGISRTRTVRGGILDPLKH